MKYLKIIFIFAVVYVIVFFNIKVYAIDTMLKVAVNPNLPPYQYVENDKLVGLHIDIMDSIAKKNNFIIEYIQVSNDEESLIALENGNVDVVLGIINNSNVRKKGQVTEGISQSSLFMIAPDGIAEKVKNTVDFRKYNAVLEKGSVAYSYIREMSNLRYIVVSNQTRAYNLLIEKKADLLVGVRNSILYQLEKDNIENNYTIVKNFMFPIEYTMLIRNGDGDLLNKFNSGLHKIRISGEYERIHNRWIKENEHIIEDVIDNVITAGVVIFVIVTAVMAFNFRINTLLKIQVDDKTRELRIVNKNLEKQIIETRNYNELNNQIVEHSPAAIIVFDRDLKITQFNNSADLLTGSNKIHNGENVLNFQIFKNILNNKLDNLFNEDTVIVNEELTLSNAEKERASYRVNIYQLHNFDSNEIRGAILTVEDITQELKIKEQIFEKDKNKSLNQIIAGIAHEIRNPLMSIKTFVELIPIKMDNKQFQSQLVEFVPKEVDRVNDLIKNLIDYAKPKLNNKEMLSVNDVINSCMVLFEPIFKKENLKLVVKQEKNLKLFADKNQIKQLLINILLNSYDSLKEKNKLSSGKFPLFMYVETWSNNEEIYIQIKDEGIGMTEEQIKLSTEPFFTTKPTGTGLGLALTRQFVEENNGEMIIESALMEYTKITLKFWRQV